MTLADFERRADPQWVLYLGVEARRCVELARKLHPSPRYRNFPDPIAAHALAMLLRDPFLGEATETALREAIGRELNPGGAT